jgi:hypothetical protein
MYYAIPPFVQLDEAGIFKLIDDILSAIFKYFPSLKNLSINMAKILIIFSKDKFLDLIKEINPNIDLNNSEFNKLFIERFMNEDNNDKEIKDILKDSKIKMKEYIEKFEESSKQNSQFYNNTKKAIDKGLAAESYKSYNSTLPNMSLIEIMTTALNNNATSFTKKAGTIADNIKLETSKTAD